MKTCLLSYPGSPLWALLQETTLLWMPRFHWLECLECLEEDLCKLHNWGFSVSRPYLKELPKISSLTVNQYSWIQPRSLPTFVTSPFLLPWMLSATCGLDPPITPYKRCSPHVLITYWISVHLPVASSSEPLFHVREHVQTIQISTLTLRDHGVGIHKSSTHGGTLQQRRSVVSFLLNASNVSSSWSQIPHHVHGLD